MDISGNLRVRRTCDPDKNTMYSFNTSDNIGYIKCRRGSLFILLHYLKAEKFSFCGNLLDANYILKEEKNHVLDFIKSIEIIYHKDKKKFYENYYRIKKFKTLFKNNLSYCKTLYKFLKGL